uniref:hypothetical protein n=1 Tax=Pseudoalteromonas sp. AC40-MNA-CIBAN-0181 TaxID=3140452 RepID=UPI00331C1717
LVLFGGCVFCWVGGFGCVLVVGCYSCGGVCVCGGFLFLWGWGGGGVFCGGCCVFGFVGDADSSYHEAF